MSEKIEERKTRTCPRCGRSYKGHPALSRKDNKTLICPLCGTIEALEAMGLPEEEIREIAGIVERSTEEF